MKQSTGGEKSEATQHKDSMGKLIWSVWYFIFFSLPTIITVADNPNYWKLKPRAN